MKVALVSGSRHAEAAGVALTERRLIETLRLNHRDVECDVRVVGGRSARRYAGAIGGRWYPSSPEYAPRRVWRSADLVHLLGLNFVPPRELTFIANVHDLSASHFPDEMPFPAQADEILRRAACFITPTATTARELAAAHDISPSRIRVIWHGPGNVVSHDTPPLSLSELAAFGIVPPFVLRVGGYTQRKNVPVLLAAWPEVQRQTSATLVLVGPRLAARDRQLADAPSLNGILVCDYIPAHVLPRLLRAASALVSPSTLEGFGLPVLEAMTAGVPVVAVRSPSAEEVCSHAALLVDNDQRSLTEGLLRVLRDTTLRRSLVAAGLDRAKSFTWDNAAQALVSVYREFASTPRRSDPRRGSVSR